MIAINCDLRSLKLFPALDIILCLIFSKTNIFDRTKFGVTRSIYNSSTVNGYYYENKFVMLKTLVQYLIVSKSKSNETTLTLHFQQSIITIRGNFLEKSEYFVSN